MRKQLTHGDGNGRGRGRGREAERKCGSKFQVNDSGRKLAWRSSSPISIYSYISTATYTPIDFTSSQLKSEYQTSRYLVLLGLRQQVQRSYAATPSSGRQVTLQLPVPKSLLLEILWYNYIKVTATKATRYRCTHTYLWSVSDEDYFGPNWDNLRARYIQMDALTYQEYDTLPSSRWQWNSINLGRSASISNKRFQTLESMSSSNPMGYDFW